MQEIIDVNEQKRKEEEAKETAEAQSKSPFAALFGEKKPASNPFADKFANALR